ncbi:hypothetical protein GJ744_011979 [Endocarpon pusillum]|uniref:Uncharacterized protein n=1 Tax=Endocarpon pusillum TaxID=364733 RepID=A0A8H7EAM9_9EURO|nr:hypothetical protein GJ744_011979 [Endocarpon pusillum]
MLLRHLNLPITTSLDRSAAQPKARDNIHTPYYPPTLPSTSAPKLATHSPHSPRSLLHPSRSYPLPPKTNSQPPSPSSAFAYPSLILSIPKKNKKFNISTPRDLLRGRMCTLEIAIDSQAVFANRPTQRNRGVGSVALPPRRPPVPLVL